MIETKIEDRIKNLIEEGRAFAWDNFASMSPNGFPDAEKFSYISWKTKVETLLENTFGNSSPIFKTFTKHKQFHVLGNYGDQFDNAQNHILGALQSALDLTEFIEAEDSLNSNLDSRKVFIVHGHDEELKNQIEIFLNEIGLVPIILHRQADQGQTVIEKFENNSDVSYAFILMTPDDVTYLKADEAKPDIERRKILVARPNVIFEFGFFVGKLGRKRVCCIYKDGVTVPTDLNGFIYKKVEKNIEEVAFAIIKDLKALGIKSNIT
jgi:predicted nucleotide-binding protein